MTNDELVAKLHTFPPGTLVAIAGEDGVPRHVARTDPASHGGLMVVLVPDHPVTEEDTE